MPIDPLKILQALDSDNKPSTGDLEAAKADLLAALNEATKPDAVPDKALATDLRAGVDKITTELGERAETERQEREELAKLREGLFDDDKATETGTGDTGGDDGGTGGDAGEQGAEEAREAEPVAASSGADIVARLTALAATKAPAAPAPKSVNSTRSRALGVAAGFELTDGSYTDVGELFSHHAKAITNPGQRGHMFRLTREFPEDRQLGFNVDLNNQRMMGTFGVGQNMGVGPRAAACGICGPGDVDHTHPICSETGRPIRNAMPQFQATRGKITFAPAASIGDLSENVSIWTLEMDEAACAVDSPASPSETPTKPCPPVACPEELTCATDAVVRCITVGNFQAQFSPEFWASRLALLMSEFDRVAEQKMIEEIHAASVNLGEVDECNTLASFLMGINSIIAADRSAQRNMTRRYRIIADAFIRDYIRNQVIRNLGIANNIEALQVADATINGWLADINASVVWTFDGTFDGTEHRILLPGEVPATGGVYIHPEDAFVFLDGGTLDLGTDIHDSMLNATNDRQAFAESFEKVCFRGCSAYYFEVPIFSGCGCSNEACTSTSPALV